MVNVWMGPASAMMDCGLVKVVTSQFVLINAVTMAFVSMMAAACARRVSKKTIAASDTVQTSAAVMEFVLIISVLVLKDGRE